MKILLFFLSFLPVILLGLYIYLKDKDKEPKKLLFVLFVSGFLSALFVIFINFLLLKIFPGLYISKNYYNYDFFILLFLVFIEMGILEEFSKWIMIRILGYRNKDFDQLYDIIVYSVFVALGFAAFENIFYVLDGGFAVGIYRAIFSVPAHVSFGVMMGYYLGYAKRCKSKIMEISFMILSILFPAVLHTVYNFCLIMGTKPYLSLFIGFMIILYVFVHSKIIDFSSRDDDLV